jgi:hypothetical protein
MRPTVEVGSPAVDPAAASRAERNPFPGPRAYRRNDQQYFFGRSEEVDELTSLVLSTSVTLLYAPSGAGKSSLLQAGVAPHIERKFGFVVLPTVHLGAAGHTPSTKGTANRFIRTVCETITEVGEEVRGDMADAAATRRRDPSGRVLLILDQFEEVFTDSAVWRERDAFFVALTRALQENTWLRAIIGLRSDYLADLVPHESSLPANLVVRYQLENLTAQQASNAIASAFTASGLGLADADLHVIVPALLKDDEYEPDRADVLGQYVNTIQLQVVCRRLWDELRDKYDGTTPVLTSRSFSVRRAMSQFVDDAISQVVEHARGSEAAIRWWLGNQLITPTGKRAFVLVDEKGSLGLPPAIIQSLEEVRLIQLEQRHGLRLAELTHDSMTKGLRTSNEAWLRSRDSRRKRAAGLLLALLIGLLAAFPFLLVSGPRVIAGPLTDQKVGSGNAVLTFLGSSGAVAVDVEISGKPGPPGSATLSVTDTQSDGGNPVLVTKDIAVSPNRVSTTVAVLTKPAHSYAAMLTARDADYKLTVSALPTVAVNEKDARIVLGSRVAVPLEPGRRELIKMDGLSGVDGVMPIQMDVSEDWALVEGPPDPRSPSIAVLRLDSDSIDPLRPSVLHRDFVDRPAQVNGGLPTPMAVDPIGSVSLVTPVATHAVGAQVSCDHTVKAKLVRPNSDSAAPPSAWINVGPTGSVLPLNALSPGILNVSQLLLDGPDGTGAKCTVGIKSFKAGTSMALGRQNLPVPGSSAAAAFPIRQDRNSVLIMDPPDQVDTSLECESPVSLTRNTKLTAFIPAGTSCDLWLVNRGSTTATRSVPAWVADLSDTGGK